MPGQRTVSPLNHAILERAAGMGGFSREALGAPAFDPLPCCGDSAARDCMVSYKKDGKTLAVVTTGRDLQALEQARMLAGSS